MSEEDVAIVRRIYEATERRDSDMVLSLYDEGLVWDHTQGPARELLGQDVYVGHAGLRQWSREWYEAWENVESELEELIDAGPGLVVGILNYRGRGRVSGIEVQFTRMAGLWELRGGKVVRARWFRSASDALAAAGLSNDAG